MNTTNNAIYLRRRGKIIVPQSTSGGPPLPRTYVASVAKNVAALGWGFSAPVVEACATLSLEQLADLNRQLVADLARAVGAHRKHRPMYPNFPDQVMAVGEAELYLNALLHYWTDGKYLPAATESKKRFPLLFGRRSKETLQKIDLGTREEFEGLFAQIAGSNTSLSPQDKEDLCWFVAAYKNAIGPLLPAAIPHKENLAFLAGLLIEHTDHATAFLQAFVRTATDVLRLAAALSGGDVSLAAPTKFRNFSRAERRVLLALVEGQANATEDMLRWKKRWIRLGERLHPGACQKPYPCAAAAFAVLRNDLPFETFNGRLEQALAQNDAKGALALLSTRPGDFARRLDHLLRLQAGEREAVLAAFTTVASRVSTPVLLQVGHHFQQRSNPSRLRVFFPKGNLAKAHAEENTLLPLDPAVCARAATICQDTLRARFAALPPLGTVYVDPALARYVVPFSQRSASRALRTIARGSRLPLPGACRVLRFFVWWKNGAQRTDIDLSAALFDHEFAYVDAITYYNLKTYGGVHSGDIVDAPEGASEFIDIDIEKVREKNVRYVVMSLNSYTQQPYVELPECFAGWMARAQAGSGEIYEPRTVQDKLDLTADTKIAIPLIIDVVDRQVIWADMSLKRYPRWVNNVVGNLQGIQLTLASLVEMRKPNLYDLLLLHAQARGTVVAVPDGTDTVFSVESGTPFRHEEIASHYLQ